MQRNVKIIVIVVSEIGVDFLLAPVLLDTCTNTVILAFMACSPRSFGGSLTLFHKLLFIIPASV